MYLLWPMVSSYAMSLDPTKSHGKTIAVTMSGSTFGLGIGLPIMTAIGIELGRGIEFGVLAAVILVIAVLGQIILPSVQSNIKSHIALYDTDSR